MEKSLVRIGNSLGIVIDKSIRKVLGVSTETVFRVSTDGIRILLEPIGTRWESQIRRPIPSDPRPTLTDVLEALPTLGALDRHGMSPDQLAQLHHAPPAPGRDRDVFVQKLASKIRNGLVREADAQELATVRRMRRCLQLLHSGCPWDVAIVAATAEYPKPEGALPPSPPAPAPSPAPPPPPLPALEEEEQDETEDGVDPSTACTGDPEAPSDGPCPCGGCATRRAQHG